MGYGEVEPHCTCTNRTEQYTCAARFQSFVCVFQSTGKMLHPYLTRQSWVILNNKYDGVFPSEAASLQLHEARKCLFFHCRVICFEMASYCRSFCCWGCWIVYDAEMGSLPRNRKTQRSSVSNAENNSRSFRWTRGFHWLGEAKIVQPTDTITKEIWIRHFSEEFVLKCKLNYDTIFNIFLVDYFGFELNLTAYYLKIYCTW